MSAECASFHNCADCVAGFKCVWCDAATAASAASANATAHCVPGTFYGTDEPNCTSQFALCCRKSPDFNSHATILHAGEAWHFGRGLCDVDGLALLALSISAVVFLCTCVCCVLYCCLCRRKAEPRGDVDRATEQWRQREAERKHLLDQTLPTPEQAARRERNAQRRLALQRKYSLQSD